MPLGCGGCASNCCGRIWRHRRGASTPSLPALGEFLSAVNGSRAKGDQAGRVLRMVAGFFEDMADVLSRVAEAMRPGASAA